MTKSEKVIHGSGYFLVSALAGAFFALFMVNKKPWLTQKRRLLKTMKDLTEIVDQLTPSDKPKIKTVKLKKHLTDEQIDHIRRHGEP